ncbi:uroporphyrinogen-III synthase [Altererythrobacter aerius]|uniref:Uroporphyrinogen-III synthase n=1 Tax=Tsuneonella aeria TaxID=1837929 RepID=A0A6I4TD00_9SPHN|nr:uroporphyrinogen-III synthase [Tsuneonella aeria]MXO74268.1 uroporphyrinogen-III synthase [Tsuneonella aeria]
MSRPLVILRPEPGLSETVAAARALGLQPVPVPLFDIASVPWAVAHPDRYDGLLVGSGNTFRHGGPGLAALKQLPTLCVGERTAMAAMDHGFAVEMTGNGVLQGVLDALVPPRRLLRIGGEERVPVTAPSGIGIDDCIVYRAVPRPLSPEGAAALTAGGLALLHSAAAARHFAAECTRLGIVRANVEIAALGPRIADAAGRGWRAAHTADVVADAALLAIAEQLCH